MEECRCVCWRSVGEVVYVRSVGELVQVRSVGVVESR